jgi:hypothetical protein
MTTQTKQRMFWIAGLALAALYFGPRFIHKAPLPVPPPPPAKSPERVQRPVPAATLGLSAPLDATSGVWQGFGNVPSLGLCNLRLELRRNALEPEHVSGFPVLFCAPAATGPGLRLGQNPVLPQMTPASAVLGGTAKDGAIAFTVDKVIGRTIDGCAFTSFTVTPFGADQISAEWQEGDCAAGQRAGQILLRRTGR